MFPESNECALMETEKRTHTYTNKIPCEDTIGRVWGSVPAKEHLELPELEEARRDPFPGSVRGSMALMTPLF